MSKDELKQEAEEYYEDETESTFQRCEDCCWFADAVQTAYVDSAEPREKRIEELDKKLYRVAKERRRLRKRNEELKIQLYDFDEEREKLRKENAEVWGNLTKAKEIIKKLMEFAEMDDREYEKEYKEAEQFIREE